MTPNKVIILGFDGVDPKVVREMISAGQLPNLEALSKDGTLDSLGTTNPAESPVSWAAFTVGANPGHTGIFDFLHRIPETYIPDIALVKREPLPDHRGQRQEGVEVTVGAHHSGPDLQSHPQ